MFEHLAERWYCGRLWFGPDCQIIHLDYEDQSLEQSVRRGHIDDLY